MKRGADRSVPQAFIAGVILAGGRSARLGQAKQLLPYRGGALLDWAVSQAHTTRLAQLVVVLGASVADHCAPASWGRAEVAINADQAAGCSASYRAGLAAVDPRADAVLILLGDQPGVRPTTVDRLLAAWSVARTPIALVRYRDGLGHPLLFARSLFPDLAALRGDKAAWKLVDRFRDRALLLDEPHLAPRDVDTWEDYRALVAASAP